MRKFKNEEEAIQEANEFIRIYAGNRSIEKCVEDVYNSKWSKWNDDRSLATAKAVAVILMKKVEALKTAPQSKKDRIIKDMETVLDFFDEFADVKKVDNWILVKFPNLDKHSPDYDPDYARAWSYTLKTFKKECSKEWAKIKRENGDGLGQGIKDFLSGILDAVSDAFNYTPREETKEEKEEREEWNDFINKVL